MLTDLAPLQAFLPCATPAQWVESAVKQIPLLLLDHAHCEKKAAANALSMIHCYPERPPLLRAMSQLAREEILHFEQVLRLLHTRHIPYRALSAGRYGMGLKQWARKQEPQRLLDLLLIGALIEARSCERFACLVPALDNTLATFYRRLVAAEARHFQTYLDLASTIASATEIAERHAFFATIEQQLILSPDPLLRFHSGIPSTAATNHSQLCTVK